MIFENKQALEISQTGRCPALRASRPSTTRLWIPPPMRPSLYICTIWFNQLVANAILIIYRSIDNSGFKPNAASPRRNTTWPWPDPGWVTVLCYTIMPLQHTSIFAYELWYIFDPLVPSCQWSPVLRIFLIDWRKQIARAEIQTLAYLFRTYFSHLFLPG